MLKRYLTAMIADNVIDEPNRHAHFLSGNKPAVVSAAALADYVEI